MITSKYEWQFAAPFSDDTFLAQAKKRGLEASAAKLLGERGIQTEEALDRFLEPRLEDLHDPYLLHDMDKAVIKRLSQETSFLRRFDNRNLFHYANPFIIISTIC